MTRSVHDEARELIALAGAEDVSAGQQPWLRAHLQQCAACRDYAVMADYIVRALRSQPVTPDFELVREAQIRVRSRALELGHQQERVWLVCLSCLFVGLSAAITTPFFWRAFQWMGAWAGMSTWGWQTGFTFFWIVPALVVSLFLLTRGTALTSNSEKQWR